MGRIRKVWGDNLTRARYLVPQDEVDRPVRRRWVTFRGAVIMSLFDLNDAAITRFGGELPSIWDTADFPWIERIEAVWTDIGQELDAYVEGHESIPHVAEITGLEPGSEEAMNAAPIDRGEWRVLILLANGSWIDETAGYFPTVREAVRDCPQMTTVGFSALEPHSHIAAHEGTNRGALRYQLPIVVPGQAGDCRIRIGDEMVHWHEGESLVFDLGTEHEAWNDAGARRVLFMIETAMPLRFPLSWLNRFVQYQYRFFPSFREMPDRIRELERQRVR